MSNINFDNPFLLLIGIPLLLTAIVPYIIAVKKDNRTVNNTISFVTHLVISILLTLAMAKTTYEIVITETNIYVLADCSYSSYNNLDKIDNYIENLEENSPRNSKIGIVCFGRDYELLVEAGDDLRSVKDSNVDDSATNIAKALEYTATLFKPNVIKRIVIVSDGKETTQSNIVSIVQALSNENIYIDAIYLDNNIKENTKEVQINQVEYISSTYLNTKQEVYALVQSNVDGKAIAKLYCDGQIYKQKAISLYDGYNSVSFDLDTSIEGNHKYKIVIEADWDTSPHNNSYLFSQSISSKAKMLFVSSLEEDKIVATSLYGDSFDIDFYINEKEVPYTVEELCKYDEIVLSNVDVRNLYNYSQLVKSIDIVVSEFGKNLITLGNTYIQNNYDDETMASLSGILPVKFGNNADEQRLVTIVMDISRSMEQISKLIIEKQIVCSILDNLDDNTMVMIVAFFGEVGTVFTPTPASMRETMKDRVNNLEAYQGTFMGSALEYTYDFITSLPYTKNEVLLISDGLPYGEQANPAKVAVTNMAQANIKVSTILTVSETGAPLMAELAEIGKGYSYFIKDEKEVESLVLNDVLNSLNEVILEGSESVVKIDMSKEELVLGVENIPNVKGLYNNTKKSSAKTILTATYTDVNNESYDIPLYAYWDYGNGRVSSFTSSLSGSWLDNWNNDDAVKVLKNIASVNIPEERISSPFVFDTLSDGNKTYISVKAPTLNKDSKVIATITYPDGKTIEKELVFDSQNYVTQIDSEITGEYNINLTYTLGLLEYSTDYAFSISYLPEYNSFTLFNASNLHYMVSTNGQVSEDGNLKLENTNSIVQKYIFDFTAPFMIASVALYIIDIMVRKLRLQDIKSLFNVFKKKEYYHNKRGEANEKKDN